MDRRDFLKKSALAGVGFMASQSVLGKIVKEGIPMDKNHTTLGSNATNSVQYQVFEERKLGKRKVTSIQGRRTKIIRIKTATFPIVRH